MSDRRIGVAAMGGDANAVLARIQELERLGIEAAWLTTGGAGLDALTLEIRLPPGGLTVSHALQALLKEASSPR